MNNILFKIKNSIFKLYIEAFISDRNKKAKMKARWAKKYLEKYADMAILEPFEKFPQDENLIIWQYWHQGEENAPEIVKKCLDSVRKNEGERIINILSFETIKNYVELPKKYYNLVNSGKIPIALFSDIIRVYLLEKYGGLWIDATIYLSGKIPQDIINSNFFVFQKKPWVDSSGNCMSCFFIRAKKGSANIQAIKRALENYWAENDFKFNYFMFEHLTTILADKTPELKAEWDKMPYYDASYTGELQKIMFKNFNPDIWKDLLSKTNIHKLTYKKQKSNNKSADNTFMQQI